MLYGILAICGGFFVISIILWAIFQGIRSLRGNAEPSTILREFIFVAIYGLALIIFLSIVSGSKYYEIIDEYNEGNYTALSNAHVLTIIIFLFLYSVSAIVVWLRGVDCRH